MFLQQIKRKTAIKLFHKKCRKLANYVWFSIILWLNRCYENEPNVIKRREKYLIVKNRLLWDSFVFFHIIAKQFIYHAKDANVITIKFSIKYVQQSKTYVLILRILKQRTYISLILTFFLVSFNADVNFNSLFIDFVFWILHTINFI